VPVRLLEVGGVAAGAVVGFVPAAVFLLPHGAHAGTRTQDAVEIAQAIHAQSGRQAYCNAWPGNPGKFWCSDYGGQRCFYALFTLRGGSVAVQVATASPIPCKFGQYDLHATPGRNT
jgi:hypothetical protein